MVDLSLKYLGLNLKNPIIIASSPLTGTIDGLKKCEKNGAAAVVLKSIFEEQIETEVSKELLKNESYLDHSDFSQYFENVSKDYYLTQYINFIKEAKKELNIPVIASINCQGISSWGEYIKAMETAGADAIELNYYPLAVESSIDGKKVEKEAIKFAKCARKLTSLPLAIKIGYKYSSLSNIIKEFDNIDINGLVLFNRFYRPDIDIEKIELSQGEHPLSTSGDYAESLRWIALMSAEVNIDLSASTGIHSGETLIKLLLAGAASCQVCSAALLDISSIEKILSTLKDWMTRHGFNKISDFKGKLAQENIPNGALWERTQYLKTLVMGK